MESQDVQGQDGCWRWLVVAASAVNNALTVGLFLSFSGLYVSWLEEFGHGKAVTSWIVSIGLFILNGGGPVVASLINRLGFRAVAVSGGLLSGLAISLSSLATSVEYLMISIGIFAGAGASMVYLASTACIPMFFVNRLPVALGISVSGVGLGTFVLSPVIDMLEKEYGWRGALLILGALSLHQSLAGMLFVLPRGKSANSDQAKAESVVPLTDTDVSDRVGWNADQDEGIPDNGSGSWTGGDVREKENRIGRYKGRIEEIGVGNGEKEDDLDTPKFSKKGHKTDEWYLWDDIGGTLTTVNKDIAIWDKPIHGVQTLRDTPGCTDICQNLEDYSDFQTVDIPLSDALQQTTSSSEDFLVPNFRWSTLGLNNANNSIKTGLPSTTISKSSPDLESKLLGYLDPLSLAALNISGASFHDIQALDKDETNNSLNSHNTSGKCRSHDQVPSLFFCQRAKQPIASNASLLRNSDFSLLAISNILRGMIMVSPLLFMVDRAVRQDIDKGVAVAFISMSGVGSIASRIGFGFLLDSVFSDPLLGYALCAIFNGVAAMLSTLCGSSVVLHGLYATMLGIFHGGTVTLLMAAIVDLVGQVKMTPALGVILSAISIGALFGTPFSGWVFDVTGSYRLTYLTMGSLMILTGAILFPVIWKRRRFPRK